MWNTLNILTCWLHDSLVSVPGLVGQVSAASRFAFTDIALVCIKTVFVCFLRLLQLPPIEVICASTTNTGARMLARKKGAGLK